MALIDIIILLLIQERNKEQKRNAYFPGVGFDRIS